MSRIMPSSRPFFSKEQGLSHNNLNAIPTFETSVKAPAAKNSSLSIGGGWSQQSGANVNVTFTKRW